MRMTTVCKKAKTKVKLTICGCWARVGVRTAAPAVSPFVVIVRRVDELALVVQFGGAPLVAPEGIV